MRDLFAVIDTNQDAAAALNSQAYLNGLQYQANFEQSIIDGGAVNTGDLQSAGTLRGVIDTGANIADNDAIAYGNLQDVNAYESRGQWFDFAKTLGEEIPGVSSILEWNDKIPAIRCIRSSSEMRRRPPTPPTSPSRVPRRCSTPSPSGCSTTTSATRPSSPTTT